jgi:hypothetical protein
MFSPRVLVLGASGRLGMMLQRNWPKFVIEPIWQYRKIPTASYLHGGILIFDPLLRLPVFGPVDLVISLAGIVPGKGELSLNVDLGLAAVKCAIALKARHVFLSSSAAIYGPSTEPLSEDAIPSPLSKYGLAKIEMEDKALSLAKQHGLKATMLRIGNVAGADVLLSQFGKNRYLDRFPSGNGPVRSYIGPRSLSLVLSRLMRCEIDGIYIPDKLNVALRGGVAMSDLCKEAGLEVIWRSAPKTALETVVLDVTRLANLLPLAFSDASEIVSEWFEDQQNVRGAF